jgi:Xaa-Pro aminopeptidase
VGTALAERLNAPASTSELERRWSAVRDAMRDTRLDALVVHSHVDGVGGSTRWFADLPSGEGYPLSIVFPLDAPMTVVMHGPMGGDRAVDGDDPAFRGIGRVLTTASFASAPYCDGYDAELVLSALAGLLPRRVGIVAPAQMPYTFLDRLIRGLDGADVVLASELVDPIKAVKSPEEQEVIRATAELQDQTLAHAFAIAEPGMRESDVAAAAQRFCQGNGSEGGIFLTGSAPFGEPPLPSTRHFQNRVIRPGDQLTFLVETSGAGGYYTHVGRIAVFGSAKEEVREEHEFALLAQRACLELLRPGAAPADVIAAYDDFMRANGRPAENRLLAHGQGYDLVERPLIRSDESMPLAAGMSIGVHPMYVRSGRLGFVCDNVLLGVGGAERIHSFPQEVVEL